MGDTWRKAQQHIPKFQVAQKRCLRYLKKSIVIFFEQHIRTTQDLVWASLGDKKNGTNCCIPSIKHTPRKFNMAPENRWLEDYFPIGMVTFQGLC